DLVRKGDIVGVALDVRAARAQLDSQVHAHPCQHTRAAMPATQQHHGAHRGERRAPWGIRSEQNAKKFHPITFWNETSSFQADPTLTRIHSTTTESPAEMGGFRDASS